MDDGHLHPIGTGTKNDTAGPDLRGLRLNRGEPSLGLRHARFRALRVGRSHLDGADLIGLVCGRASLGEEEQRAEGRAALTAWLRAQLMGDAAARSHVQAGGPQLTIESRDMEGT